jgi:hypothetical protein
MLASYGSALERTVNRSRGMPAKCHAGNQNRALQTAKAPGAIGIA